MALWKSGRSLPNSSGASKVKTSAGELAHRAVEAAARQSYGRLVALLAARTRDPAGAEDALADALLAALNTWARDGIPKNPQAWLLTAARNRLLDHARHLEVRERSASTLETLANELYEAPDPDALPDERLKLLFVCAHPAIDPDMHTPLMLQTVLGLDAVAIGRAFLVSPKAMGQRLARAKTKIRQARIAFEIPAADQIPQRLEAVLNAIYAAYDSSWEDAGGRDQRAVGLAEEAIWLARVLRDQMPHEPEVRGLLALLLHCEARRPAAARTADSFHCRNKIPANGSRHWSTRPRRSLRCRPLMRAWGDSRSKRRFNRCTPNALTPGARIGLPSSSSTICLRNSRHRSALPWRARRRMPKSTGLKPDWRCWIKLRRSR
jgi:DNA-directed RNA polymerase specialized sigma24 family protein